MKLRRGEVVSLILVVISFIVAWVFYPELPEKVASHWNVLGEVDGYTNRFWGAFLLPLVLTAMLVLFLAVPRIDPKRENIQKFRGYFDQFIVTLFLFLIYLDGLTLAWNLGYSFNLMRFLSPAFAVLFYVTGVMVTHARTNWTIGIRTPWTLSSPQVWQKTHNLGGKLFMLSGIIALLGVIFPFLAVWFVVVPVILSSIITVLYSYLEFNKLKR